VHLPLIVALGAVAVLAVRFHRIRWWAVIALVLFGFYLGHTVLAPAIDQTTRTGIHTVNQH